MKKNEKKLLDRIFHRSKQMTDSLEVHLERPENGYYESVSVRFGYAQVILFVALFVFVVFSFLRNSQLITYSNFYYFFKDLNASAESVDLNGVSSVTYPTDTEQSFTLYRNGLAVAGNQSVTVFSATGRQTVSKLLDHYSHPVAIGSGKYLLVYESGGNRYSLYNFYNLIHSGTTEYPIASAAISDCGMYALISSSESYTSVVSLYNDRFELINRYNKNGYVMDVSIDEKGTHLAILTSDQSGSAFSTRLEIYRAGTDTPENTVTLGSSIGVDCEYTDPLSLTVLCSTEIYFLKSDGSLKETYSFDGKSLQCAQNSENGIAVCLKGRVISEKNMIILFDKSGKMMYNNTVPERIEQIALYEDTAYLLFSGGIRRVQKGNEQGELLLTDTEERILLALGKDEFLLCSPQKAVYMQFPKS